MPQSLATAHDDLAEELFWDWELPMTRSTRVVRPIILRELSIFSPGYERAFVSGLELLIDNERAKAVARFEKARRLAFPNLISPSFFAGFCAATSRGRDSEAIRWLLEALESEVELPDALMKRRVLYRMGAKVKLTLGLWAPIWFNRAGAAALAACTLRDLGDPGRAVQVLDGFEFDPPAAALKADLLVGLNRLAGVLAMNEVANRNDASCHLLISRAKALIKLERHEEALTVLGEALSSAQRAPELLEVAGDLRSELRNYRS